MASTNMASDICRVNFLGGVMLLLFAFQACQPLEDENILIITTDHIEFVSEGSYRFSATLVSMGEDEITQHGFCWSESKQPDIYGPTVKLGPPASTGKFSCKVSGLAPVTTYVVRAFAEINSTPVYADVISFTTDSSSSNIVMDIDGNIYSTIQIGEQVWMAENLKVTRYPDGSLIPHVEDHQEWFHLNRESEGYCWYENVLTNGYVYGALYTWPTAVDGLEISDLIPSDIQGVCPDGWHLPSDGEWKQLEMFLGMSQADADREDWRGAGVADKLKQAGTLTWEGPNSEATNETGFSALPGGYRHGSGEFLGLGTTARFWSTSKNGYSYGWFRRLDYDNSSVNRSYEGVYRGHSVRCVKDK